MRRALLARHLEDPEAHLVRRTLAPEDVARRLRDAVAAVRALAHVVATGDAHDVAGLRVHRLLDIPRWSFHWQNAYTLEDPVRAEPGDVVRVTCRHDVRKRTHGGHRVPSTPRYVLWGEGTTDEMCLGILQVTRG